MCACSQKSTSYPGLYEKKIEGADSLPLLCSHEAPSEVLNSAQGFPMQERPGPVQSGSRGWPDQRTGASLLWRKAEGAGLIQPEKRKFQGDIIVSFQYLKGDFNKDDDRVSIREHSDRLGDSGFKLEADRLTLETKKELYPIRMERH